MNLTAHWPNDLEMSKVVHNVQFTMTNVQSVLLIGQSVVEFIEAFRSMTNCRIYRRIVMEHWPNANEKRCTTVAVVTNTSRFVHNGLIGATIVASGVYLHIYSHHGEASSTIKTTSFKHLIIKNMNFTLLFETAKLPEPATGQFPALDGIPKKGKTSRNYTVDSPIS